MDDIDSLKCRQNTASLPLYLVVLMVMLALKIFDAAEDCFFVSGFEASVPYSGI
jgi:hypothetical protein